MSEVRIFKYKTALARKMAAPGGLLVSAALANADRALADHREGAMRSLDTLLTELSAATSAKARSEIYPKAAELLDMAGFFETGPLHPALFSLCEITDWMSRGTAWDWPCVHVHVHTLRMILNDDCRDTEDSRLLLEGLNRVRQSVRRRSSPGDAPE